MKIANIHTATDWFEVLHTTDRSQIAAMTLAAGKATGDEAEAHESSEQVLLLLAGQLLAEIGGEQLTMRAGDFVTIPPGVKHRFSNDGTEPAVTFNVYIPPEYPAGAKG